MKRLLLFTLMVIAASHGQDAKLSVFHSIEPMGVFKIRVNMNDAVNRSPASDLPLGLVFNSKGEYSSILPGGWNIPVIDSHIVKEEEGRVVFKTPIGDSFSCELRDTSISGGGWIGCVEGDKITMDRDASQEKVEFKAGKISRYANAEELFSWIYDSKGLLIMVKKNNSTYFTVNRKVSGVDDYLVIMGQKDLSVHSLRSNGVSGVLADYVTQIKYGEEVVHIELGKDRTSGLNELTIDETNWKRKYGWDNSGIIKFADEMKYEVIYPHKLAQSPHVFETANDGTRRLLFQAMGSDFKKSTNLTFRENGSYEESFGMTSHGVHQVRKIVEHGVDGSSRLIYRAYYDNEGKLLKDWTPKSERKREGELFKVYENGKFAYSYPADY